MSIFNGSLKQQLEGLKAAFQPLGIDLGAISSPEDLEAELGKSYVAKADHDAVASELLTAQEALKTSQGEAASAKADLEVANGKVEAYEKVFGALKPAPGKKGEGAEDADETPDLKAQAEALKAKAAAEELARNASGIDPATLAPNGQDDDNLSPREELEKLSVEYQSEKDIYKAEALYSRINKLRADLSKN